MKGNPEIKERQVKCTKNGYSISYEIPKGEKPILFAKERLKETFKKTPYGWQFELLNK